MVSPKAQDMKYPAEGAARDLESATRVLRLEAEGIEALANGLDGSFVAAVDRLAGVTGRIIVTGIGKSGHVARKIAATLASTGSPAYYVHPTEASHGDLGMITSSDAVIAISNSGETTEIGDLLEYSRRYSIPMIAITAKPTSTLAETADVVLLLPNVPEACPMGLAPTTSTTVSLALGDALAVALLERKGFSAQDFRIFHPGGKLGASLLRVADLMHTGGDIPLATADTPMSEAVVTMTAKRKGCVGIMSKAGRLIGIITDGDIRRHTDTDLLARSAGDLMTSDPRTIRPQALAAEAVALMSQREITSLFVVSQTGPNDDLIGIIHMHDCLKAGVA